MNITPKTQTTALEPDNLVKDTSMQHFMKDVIHGSLQQPVVVYFWSPRSPACKEFDAVLQKQVKDAKGAVKMVRVDIDTNPQIATQFRIQSVPSTYIFLQGQPLDGFAGPLPEAQLKEIFSKLSGMNDDDGDLDAQLAEARRLHEEGDSETAIALYQSILVHAPENNEAIAGLARAYIAADDHDQAEAVLNNAPNQNDVLISGARAALSLAQEAGADKADVISITQALQDSPDDHSARYGLACTLFAHGKQEAAIDELLTIIRKDREWNEQEARKQLLKFFEALGPTHPLTVQGRRKLSSILFA